MDTLLYDTDGHITRYLRMLTIAYYHLTKCPCSAFVHFLVTVTIAHRLCSLSIALHPTVIRHLVYFSFMPDVSCFMSSPRECQCMLYQLLKNPYHVPKGNVTLRHYIAIEYANGQGYVASKVQG
jgi:hypothetical protein